MYQLAFLKDGQTIALAELPQDCLELRQQHPELIATLSLLLSDADRRLNPLDLQDIP
jgi:hypothetical protein